MFGKRKDSEKRWFSAEAAARSAREESQRSKEFKFTKRKMWNGDTVTAAAGPHWGRSGKDGKTKDSGYLKD